MMSNRIKIMDSHVKWQRGLMWWINRSGRARKKRIATKLATKPKKTYQDRRRGITAIMVSPAQMTWYHGRLEKQKKVRIVS